MYSMPMVFMRSDRLRVFHLVVRILPLDHTVGVGRWVVPHTMLTSQIYIRPPTQENI